MNVEEAKTILESALGDKIKELTTPAPRRMFITVEAADVLEAVRAIREKLGITHLSTMTGLDTGERFEVLYHFATRGLVPTLKVIVDREKPVVHTILGFYPAAVFYEREVHDLIGVHIEGHPDLRPLVLPDGWPADVHPLRKDWIYNRGKGVIE